MVVSSQISTTYFSTDSSHGDYSLRDCSRCSYSCDLRQCYAMADTTVEAVLAFVMPTVSVWRHGIRHLRDSSSAIILRRRGMASASFEQRRSRTGFKPTSPQ